MVLRLNDVDLRDQRGLVQEWWFGARPFFMLSSAYEVLARELTGYVQGDIRGRSFLIAAHRGVGKTSLVLRAVADLDRALLLDAAQGGLPAGTSSQRSRPTPLRPLLVKLHGSALIAPAKPDRWAAPNAGAKPAPSAETALQQITIALYRALASEIAEAFTLHAREATSKQPPPHDLQEMAAQLTLDLDLAPDLAALRTYWQRIDCLESGVLWPSSVGRQLAASGIADRGMREIVAVTTANQAFQVCAGRVEASQSAKGSAERTARMETATRIDAKDAANKLFGLTAGALVGGALLPSAGGTAAAAAGLSTALLGTLALGWSSERRQRSERSTDYTFIMDRSLQTLDRDLPVVIQRIREAGLAPVFLIDELDKLDAPTADIEQIVKRLKSLTTDYGFFCFLTDRAYFEEVEAKLRATAYPTQHTFFSHRLLLLYRPAELARYVRELWTTDVAPPWDAIAAWILTCVVLHRARLNAMDVRRELVRLCRGDGNLRADPDQVAKDAHYLVPMAVQLAIEHVLRLADIRVRIETDSAFAQLAFDVLYMISRAWDDGKTKVVVDETSVYADLVDRRSVDGDKEAAKSALDATATKDDISVLTAKALRLARLLTSFPDIYSAIYAEERPSPLPSAALPPPFTSTTDSEGAKLVTLAPLLTAIPGVPSGLLEANDRDPPGTFRFRFDRYGVAYMRWDESLTAVREALGVFDGLRDGLAANGMDIAGLAAAGVLPRTLDQAALEQSAARLRLVRDTASLQMALREDIDRLTGLTGALRQLRRAVVGIVALAARVMEDFVPSYPTQTLDAAITLRMIDRMLGLAPLVAALSAPSGTAVPLQSLKSPNSPVVAALLARPPAAVADDAATWRDEIAAERERQRGLLATPADSLPADSLPAGAWQERVAFWMSIRPEHPNNPPIFYSDITEATSGRFPSVWLRPDLDAMTITEWSAFTNAAFAHRGNELHGWALVAGLRALGFGQRILEAAGGGGFAQGAVPDRPGLWMVFARSAEIAAAPDPAGIPMVFVPADAESGYKDLEVWLTENDALAAKTRKED